MQFETRVERLWQQVHTTGPSNPARRKTSFRTDHQESIPAALGDRLESFDSAHAVGWFQERKKNKLSTHFPSQKKGFWFTLDGVTGRILIYFLQVAPPEVHSAVQSTESDCHSACHAPFVDRPKWDHWTRAAQHPKIVHLLRYVMRCLQIYFDVVTSSRTSTDCSSQIKRSRRLNFRLISS